MGAEQRLLRAPRQQAPPGRLIQAEPYRMAANKLGVKTRDLLLVAAHPWGIAGAMRAGCRTAFVRRPEHVLDELTPRPDFVVPDLIELAEALSRSLD